jgi:hypothetical protein
VWPPARCWSWPTERANVRFEGEVQGVPRLRYSWNRDESLLHLTYDDPHDHSALSRYIWTATSFGTMTGKSLVGLLEKIGSASIRLPYCPIC